MKKGITLISLVITIIIILILAGVGISGSLSLIEQAKYTAFINEMKQIDEAGNLFAWGYNNHGQVGNITTETQTSPAQIKSGIKFTQITAVVSTNLATDENGNLWGWGSNSVSQIIPAEETTRPIKVISAE